MNKGLSNSHGEYVIFMNSGDTFTENSTVEQIITAILEKRTTYALVYGNYRESNNNTYSTVIPAREANKIWYGIIASHQSTLYNLNFLKKLKLKYDLSYKIAADYKLTTETLIKSNYNVFKLPICISDFDTTGISNINQNIGLKEANRARREVLGLNSLKIFTITFILLCARNIKKYLNPLYRLIRH